MIDLEIIKSRVSCLDILAEHGIQLKPGGRCVSPIRPGAKNKTSFVCYSDWFYDFGAASGGDCIDLEAELNHGGDKGAAIRALAARCGVEDDGSASGWLEYTKNLNAKIAMWHSNLSAEYRKYCNDRGITDETIDRLRIGQTPGGRLCIPYYSGLNGYVSYYITRVMPGSDHPDSKYMKMKVDEFNNHIPWGMWTLNRNKDLLVIAEGAFDVMSFEQENYACLSAITGHFSKAQLPQVLKAAKTFKKVFLVYDNDLVSHAGEKFTIKMSKILFGENIPFIVGKVPAGYKDVSEYYQAGGNLQDIIDEAQDGGEFICSILEDRVEFEQTVRKACRFMSKTDVALLFDKLARLGRWDAAWLKALKQDCSSAPSEDAIVKEVASKHRIMFHRSIGFVEWQGKCWQKITDEVVMSYIGEALGVYRTGNKLTSILKVIKSEVNSDELLNLNRKPVMNFINGTLELEPKVLFREHSEDDLCSYVLDYPYNPSARSSVWEHYLQTATDYDDKKISLLQEFAGYSLFTDCPLHKALCLIGDGRNGKSIYANAIVDVIGKANVSTVSMNDLTKDFHSIDLAYSMINVASETRSDVTGAEDKFKKAVVGETLRDSYKGKDVVDFEPRAKWMLLCNNFMVSKTDASDGWIKRFCFCEFNLQFVDEPKLPHERRADRTLENKLKSPEQLSAIFNWVLEGYVLLKQTMTFSEPDDQRKTTEEFIETTNPVVVFIREFNIEQCQAHAVTCDDLYTAYKFWAAECNHKPMTKTAFVRKIPKIIQANRPDMEPYQYGNSRGWRKVEEQGKEVLL